MSSTSRAPWGQETELSAEVIAGLRDIFRKFDNDDSGEIDVSEAAALLKDLGQEPREPNQVGRLFQSMRQSHATQIVDGKDAAALPKRKSQKV